MNRFPIKTSAKFISFEGIDGCGKTTQARMLADFLKKINVDCIYTREPGGTQIGQSIREIVAQGKLDGKCELLLILSARRQHIKEIILPALESNVWVICDRFIDSTLCYQGIFKEVGQDFICKLHKDFCYDLWPDITFMLDLVPEISKKRIESRECQLKGYDSLSAQQYDILRKGFLCLKEKFSNRIELVNAENTELALHNTIISTISARYS